MNHRILLFFQSMRWIFYRKFLWKIPKKFFLISAKFLIKFSPFSFSFYADFHLKIQFFLQLSCLKIKGKTQGWKKMFIDGNSNLMINLTLQPLFISNNRKKKTLMIIVIMNSVLVTHKFNNIYHWKKWWWWWRNFIIKFL